jgi:hypothetical protein
VNIQAVLSEEEYKNEYLPALKKSGLSESSYVRECLGLSPKREKKGKALRGKCAPAPRAKGESGVAPSADSTLPFLGHRTDEDGDHGSEAGGFEEIIDESNIPPPDLSEFDAETVLDRSKTAADQDERRAYGLDLLDL